MNNQIFDGHVHFDLEQLDPIYSLTEKLKKNNISRVMIILNSDKEKTFFINNYKKLFNQNIDVYIAVLLDFKDAQLNIFLAELDKLNIPYHLKLHPRISGIDKSDFIQYRNLLNNFDESKVIIIDSFPYGHKIENNIGIELAVYLAEYFRNRKIVLAHSGGVELLKGAIITRTLKNIIYDLSLTANYLFDTSVYFDIINLIKHNKDRVIYGSDYPDFEFKDAIENVIKLCTEAKLQKFDINKIFFENSINLYGDSWRETWKLLKIKL